MIGLYGCAADDNALYVLDDPSLTTDSGEAIEAYYLTAAFEETGALPFARLRRLVQNVSLAAPATVRLTPVVDGAEATGQAQEVALATEDGQDQQIEVGVARAGNRYQMRIDVLAHAGPLAFGSAELHVVPKRSIS